MIPFFIFSFLKFVIEYRVFKITANGLQLGVVADF